MHTQYSHVWCTPCNVISAVVLKQLTLVAAGAIASRISGLSVVTSHVQRCRERKLFSSGRMASGHLPLVHTHACMHTRTDNYNLASASANTIILVKCYNIIVLALALAVAQINVGACLL